MVTHYIRIYGQIYFPHSVWIFMCRYRYTHSKITNIGTRNAEWIKTKIATFELEKIKTKPARKKGDELVVGPKRGVIKQKQQTLSTKSGQSIRIIYVYAVSLWIQIKTRRIIFFDGRAANSAFHRGHNYINLDWCAQAFTNFTISFCT